MWRKSSTDTAALSMIKVFLDTNILVSATFWEGSSYKLLVKISRGKLIGFTTQEIMQEYRSVLKRDFAFSEERVDKQIEKLLKLLIIVTPSESIKLIKGDPSDDKVLEGAVAATANFIISYDFHLLNLKKFREIIITKPEELLKKL